MGHGKLGLRGWEAKIKPCVKGGFWQSAKTKGQAFSFCSRVAGTLYFDGWNLAEKGAGGFEVVAVFNRLT